MIIIINILNNRNKTQMKNYMELSIKINLFLFKKINKFFIIALKIINKNLDK
jgi:hypothetical protein